MENRHEFVTTRWQYQFSQTLKSIEFAFAGILGAIVVTIVFPPSGEQGRAGLFVTALLPALFMWLSSLLYAYVRLTFFNADPPTLVIDHNGVRVSSFFGETQTFSWSDITDVRVVGRFRKMIHLNKNSRSALYRIEYYLFSPEQREKILQLLHANKSE